MNRVLVVDDDADVRLMLRRVLEHVGYHIEEAVDGGQALTLCRSNSFDAVLMDILMKQGKGGIEAIIELRKAFPDLKIIAMSGGGDTRKPWQYLDLATQFGAVQAIPKPIDVKALVKLLHELTGGA